MIDTIEKAASESQIRKIQFEIHEREMTGRQRAHAIAEIAARKMTAHRASVIINWLVQQPKASAPRPEIAQKVINGKGVYQGGSGRIYSSAFAPNSTFLIFRVVAEFGDKHRLIKVWHKSAITDIETGGRRLTLDEADKLGCQFNFCLVCGKQLTATESVLKGIGPVCAKKTLWA